MLSITKKCVNRSVARGVGEGYHLRTEKKMTTPQKKRTGKDRNKNKDKRNTIWKGIEKSGRFFHLTTVDRKDWLRTWRWFFFFFYYYLFIYLFILTMHQCFVSSCLLPTQLYQGRRRRKVPLLLSPRHVRPLRPSVGALWRAHLRRSVDRTLFTLSNRCEIHPSILVRNCRLEIEGAVQCFICLFVCCCFCLTGVIFFICLWPELCKDHLLTLLKSKDRLLSRPIEMITQIV